MIMSKSEKKPKQLNSEMQSADDTVCVSVYMPRTLSVRLKRLAEQESRALSKQIVFILSSGVNTALSDTKLDESKKFA